MAIEWKSTEPIDLRDTSRLERVIGINNFQQPWFLKKGWDRSRAVGVLPSSGTVFLIRDNLIMTNWHIFRRADWATNKSVIFGYENGEDGVALLGEKFKLQPDKFFYSNEELDFAVVQVDGNPGQDFGIIDLSNQGKVQDGISVNIIQHPGGELKKIAIKDNELRFHDEKIIQYWTDTEHGSSGSPVFDDLWNIIGLHYQENSSTDVSGAAIYFNEAHTISTILENLKATFPTEFG